MNIHQCEKLAQDEGFDSMRFMAVFPTGTRTCRWSDAYMGLFMIEDDPEFANGFLTVSQIDNVFPNLLCIPLED